MLRDDWIVLDTETTSLGPDAEPVAIAVVAADGTVLFNELVRPFGRLAPTAQRVHGILDADIASAPVFASLAQQLFALLHRRPAIAYNAVFDRSVVEHAFMRSGLSTPDTSWHCGFEWYRSWRGFRASLRTACEVEGLRGPTRHAALEDALALRRLVLAIAGETVIP